LVSRKGAKNNMLENIGKIAGMKIMLVVHSGTAAMPDCALAFVATVALVFSMDRWHGYFATLADLISGQTWKSRTSLEKQDVREIGKGQ
jgi:hypothetical protein